MKSISLICVLINLSSISCGPLFFRGRPHDRYGMRRVFVSDSQTYELAEVPEEKWFDQRLNHFDPVDNRTWKQRYFINETFYKSGGNSGPIFLELGGEGEVSNMGVVRGMMAKIYAKKFGAMSVVLEHRYYGKSRPTADLSVENLSYLTSEQALQDSAYFIEYLTEKLSLNQSKWIVFGGSYAGALSAWFRAKYPHLVEGAIASSAPVKAIINFKDYLGVVSNSLGENCDNSIRDATKLLAQEFNQPLSWKEITKNFKLCDEFNATDINDVYNLMNSLVGNFQEVVQYNLEGRITIDVVCDIMTNQSLGNPLKRYEKVNELILRAHNRKCVDYKYDKFIKEMSETNWNSSASDGGRQWTYQTCVEFGFFQSSDLKSQPFGSYLPIEFFIKQCADIFGSDYNLDLLKKGVEFTNNFYGGLNLKVRKVVFPNGSIDPWHVLGITKDFNKDSKAILINGTAHCADMIEERDSDPTQLKEARMQIIEALGNFLN